MKTLMREDYLEIRSFVYRNARPLEYALWNYHFEGGSVESVLAALAIYQNEDGGFGNKLEPDSWNPESTPYTTDFAIKMLRSVHFYDITHPIYQGIFGFLENTKYQGDYGWFFTIPHNDLYPHAIWWTYSDEGNKNQNIGITASLSGFLLRYIDKNTSLYHKAMEYTRMLFDRLQNEEDLGDMGIIELCSLYQDLKEAGLGDEFDLNFLEDRTRTLIQEHFHEYVWTNHQDMANVLSNPSLYYYKGHEQAVSDALDELIEIRPKNGVWGVPWEWYDNGKYDKEFAISENWWKSIKSIEKLLFLKAHGRMIIT